MNKLVKFVVICCLIFNLVIATGINIFANETISNNETLEKYPLDKQQSEEIWQRLELTPIQSSMLKSGAIYSFDVNCQGEIVLYFKQGNNSYIEVFDSEGLFLYGFSLAKFKATDYVFWEGSNICFHYVDSYVIVFNQKGEQNGILGISNSDKNDTFKNNVLKSNQKTVGNKRYILTNENKFSDKVFTSYGKFYIIDEYGKEIVIYDHSFEHNFKLLLPWFLIISLITLGCVFIIKQMLNVKTTKA